MPYSRYDRKDIRRPEPSPIVSPWENGFPQGQDAGAGQLSIAGNLLGQLFGGSTGVGVGNNLMSALVMNPSAILQPGRGSILPLGGSSGGSSMPFRNQSSFNGGQRERDYNPRSGRISPRPRVSSRRSRSRSRSREASRRVGRDERRSLSIPHKRYRSPERPVHEIYIGNYPGRFKEHDIRSLFEDHNIKVTKIRLKHEGQKVFAFAETDSKEEIENAVKALDSKEISGRRLRVRSAKNRDVKTTETATKETKKEIDLTEAHVKRHLAFAFVQFIDRQLSSNDEFNVEKLKDAKEAVKNAFNLPEDDSLKVNSRLETMFFQNSRREIKPPKIEEKVASAKNDASDETCQSSKIKDEEDEENAQNDHYEDDTGNWKRRKVADDDEDDFDFDEPVFEDKSEVAKDENVDETTPAKANQDVEMEAAKDVNELEVGNTEEMRPEDVNVQTVEDDDVLELEDETTKHEIESEEEIAGEEESSTPSKQSGRGGAGRGRARRSRGRRP